MEDSQLFSKLRKDVIDSEEKVTLPSSLDNEINLPQAPSGDIVLAEIPVSNVQLHKIGVGECCTLAQPGEVLGVRFLLKSSFKARQSNFVVNNFVMQIVATGKQNAMRKEDIAVLTKVKVEKAKVPEKKKVQEKKLDEYKKEEGEDEM